MENILLNFVIVIGILVITSIVNEKKFKLPHEVAILSVSFLLSVVISFLQSLNIVDFTNSIIGSLREMKLDTFLFECTLCFMMFAVASKINLNKIKKNIRPIALLSIITTIVSSILYSGLFFVVTWALQLKLSYWFCLLVGSIASVSDSLGAVEVLKKFNFSKSLAGVMEGESLFNDGTVVAIILFAKNMIQYGATENIFILLGEQILGAFAVGLIVPFILFKLVKMTNEPTVHILISLLAVSLSYVICEHFGFSGVIASVICGLYFSYQNAKIARWKEVVDPNGLYNDFWKIADNLLTSVLFVLIGLSVLSIDLKNIAYIIMPLAILLNLVCRYAGVLIATLVIGIDKLPGNYDKNEFVALLTWSGLKGGVPLALTMTCKNILNAQEYEILFTSIIITILFTTIVQGFTMEKVFNKIEKNKDERINSRSLRKI